MGTKTLIRGGTVLTMDPAIGNLSRGDVLVEDDTIVAVEPEISADAEVLDATGSIVIPGFVDTHRHTWEAAIRGCAPNATLDDYFVEVLDTFAPLYRPEDVHASNVAGSLECLNAGITTLVDWSHINNTPEHPDAGVTGLQETGIRALYAYGSANTSLAAYWLDRELDIPITVHVAMGRLAGRFGMIKQLSDYGLLGPDTTYVHCCHFSDEEWRLVAESGGRISLAPQVEVQMGHGWPPVIKSIEHGLRPSLSIDVVTTVPGDMFTQMRSAFGSERARVNAVAWEANVTVPETMLTARQVLETATLNGAYVAGLEDRTGSLSPGKRADIVVLDATAINMTPIHDPVAAVVLMADVSNVEHVLVDGEFRKRDFRLTGDLAKAQTEVQNSRDRLLDANAKAKANA